MKNRRATVQAKKAKAELEETKKMTMRMDGVGAMSHALEEIEAFIENGDIEHLQQARDYLAVNIAGARGGSLHAEGHFKKAIEELEAVEGIEDDAT